MASRAGGGTLTALSSAIRRWPRWTAALAATAFVLHAANYLYFFVDDEAIPFDQAMEEIERGMARSQQTA